MEPRWEVLTVKQAATLLQISEDGLYRLLKRDLIPGAVRVGDAWRIYAPAIHQWLRGEWPKGGDRDDVGFRDLEVGKGSAGKVGPGAEHITS